MTSDAAVTDPSDSGRSGTPTTMVRTSALLAASSGLVGATSYVCSLLMARLLSVSAYSDFSAGQALLTTVGIAASALVPLPLARIVRTYPSGSSQRRAGMAFAIMVSLLSGMLVAGVLAGITSTFADPVVVVVVAACGLVLFAIMPVWGWLQGESRFGGYALLSLMEVLLRLALSVLAAVIGFGAAGALAGYLAGASAVLIVGAVLLRRDIAWQVRTLTDRSRWLETSGIAVVQLVLSMLTSADVVLVAVSAGNSPAAAGYQAVATLAKGPVYVAAGTVLISFPLLRSVGADRVQSVVRSALRSFAWLALPAAAVLATLPSGLALMVLPARYAPSLPLLPWLAVAGLGLGTTSVMTIVLLGLRAHWRCVVAVASSALFIAGGMALGWSLGATHGLAIGLASGSVAAATAVGALSTPYLPTGIARAARRVVMLSAALVGVLVATRSLPWLWLAAVIVIGIVVVSAGRRASSSSQPTAKTNAPLLNGLLRVTHLGFEDPAMPGAGGGSLRTHEIDRRLAARGHAVTVLVTRYPGCVDRVENEVRYVHIGFGKGTTRLTRLLGYVLALPRAARRYSADLVVEDFFAPISTMAAPLWSGVPTVGMVQWLNARDKARQYHLPLHLIERFGVRRHRRLIAVSAGVAEQLTAINPKAQVEVIGNGVDPDAFTAVGQRGSDVVFIGRLEVAQKGLDLLLRAWAIAAPQLSGQLVLAGVGPDEPKLLQMATQLGVADRVRFIGWVSGSQKFQLLAGARFAVVPSRFETFGIVAVEALATGTPVLAFDIPCLREVIPVGCGQLVSPFDVRAYADALVELYQDEQRLLQADAEGRQFAARYDWDTLAARQEGVYHQLVAEARSTLQPQPGTAAGEAIREQLHGLGRDRTRGRRPPRLTVVGNVGNGNTGDEALLSVTLAALDPDAEVAVLARRPAMVTRLHGVPARPMTIRAALAALRGSDGLVIVGGGMFGPGLPPLVRLLPRVAAAVARTRRSVSYVGIGVYPGTSRGTLRALRRAARRSQITVRDQLSLRTLDVRHPVACVGDLAWQLVPAEPDQARAELGRVGVELGRPLLLVSPKAGPSEARTAEQIAVMSAAVRQWRDLGGSVAAIALSDRADRGRSPQSTDTALAQTIAAEAGTALPVVGPNLRPSLAKAITGEATVVLGLRFHSLVFASSTATPSMGFAWEPKTCALLDEHHVAAYTTIPALHAWLNNTIPAPDTARR